MELSTVVECVFQSLFSEICFYKQKRPKKSGNNYYINEHFFLMMDEKRTKRDLQIFSIAILRCLWGIWEKYRDIYNIKRNSYSKTHTHQIVLWFDVPCGIFTFIIYLVLLSRFFHSISFYLFHFIFCHVALSFVCLFFFTPLTEFLT